MDSRDSMSAAASDAGRDGPVSDDDAVLSVTSALAKDAVLYFQSGKFAECIDVLNQLKQKKENDPKVFHNIAIAEYFRDGCSNPKKLLEALNSVKKRNEELARTTREQVEAANIGNKLSKDSSMGAQNSSTVCNDEFDNSVTILNIAVIWFHLHEYAKALSVLEPLFQNIEPVDETIALQICFLLLDVVLACHDAAKFAAVLNYMEKAFGVGCVSQSENGSASQLATNQVSKTSSLPTGSLAPETSNSDLAVAESTLSRSLSEETLEYDNVLAEIGAQNLTKPVDRFPANNLLKAIGDRSISTVDLKLELQLYKVRFLLLTRNLKLAKREVKHAMNIARGRDSSMALLLKSQLEYARGNHRKAIKLLMASGIQAETGTSSIFNNNLGCIYYQLGQYQTSSVLFSKALSVCSSLRKEKPVKLFTLSQDKSLLVTYNCGLLYLASGKPILAARCFQKSSLVFYRQPLLWLRIAECCLMALQNGLLEEGHAPSDRSEVRVHVVGKGKWRQLILEENGHVDISGNTQWPKLSLSLARLCLSNAMYMLNGPGLNDSKLDFQSASSVEANELTEASIGSGQAHTNADTKEAKGGMSQDITQNSLLFYEDVRARENHMIKQALLANMSFVELEMENPIKALSAANSLLELPDCSRIYVFLGNMYAAEALCSLNRTKEAGDHLSVYLSGQDNFEPPFLQQDCDQWRMHRSVDCEEPKDSSTEKAQDTIFLKPEEARGTLYANLAALFATQGDLDRAQHLVTQALLLLPNNVQATVTAIYIELMLGKTQDAVTRLKQCNRVRFFPGALQVGKSS